jgi:hypothetical protein
VRRRGGKGKEAGEGRYQVAKLRRQLDVEERWWNGGASCGTESMKGGDELGFARHEGGGCGRWEVKRTGDAIYGAAEGPRRASPGVCWPDSGSSPSLA